MADSENEIERIFDEYDGSVSLKKIDNFLQRHVGKTETYFKHLTNVFRQALKRPTKNLDLFDMCLPKLEKILSYHAVLFIDGKTPGLILKVLEKMIALNGSDADASRLTSVIESILDITTTISDVNDEGKSAVLMFVHPCLNFLADERRALGVRLQATKFLNNVIESFVRQNVDLGKMDFVVHFDRLLVNAGDLELQLCMTELICRMLPYENRYSHALQWFNNHLNCRNDFLAIRDVEFESDCRKFINNLNERQLENRSVYSVLCKEVFLGSYKVNCPVEEDCGLFWTDFNLGSKSISFFAIDTESDNAWETVTINESIISQAKLTERSHAVVLLLHLNQPAHTLLPSCSQSDKKYVKFIYDENHSPVTAASQLFPKYFATNPPPSPEDVIASTPKASVAANVVHLSSRAKGLSKTVSLSTPRRRKGDGKSSDDSSKSKDPGPGKDKQSEKSISNELGISSGDVQDDISKVQNPTVPDQKKRTGKPSTKPDEPPDLSKSDGNASGEDIQRKTGKVKASSSIPAVRVESDRDDGPGVRTRSSRGNGSDSGDASVTRTKPLKPGKEQLMQSLKPRVDDSVTDQESSKDAGQRKSEIPNEDTKSAHGAEKRGENKVEGSRSQKKSADNNTEIDNGMDVRSKLGNGVDITRGPKKDMDNRSNAASSIDESVFGKSVDSGLGKSLDKQDLTVEDSKGYDGSFVNMSQDEPTVINETQTRSQEGEETTLDDQDEDPLRGIALPGVGDDGPKDGKKTDDEGGRSSGPFEKPSVSEKSTKVKKSDIEEDERDIRSAFEKAFARVPTKAVKGKITKEKKDYVEDGEGEISAAFERKTTEVVKRKLVMEKEDEKEDERKGGIGFENKTTRTVRGTTRQPRTRAAARRYALLGHSVSTSESGELADTETRPRTRAKSAGPSVSVSKVSTSSSGDSLEKKKKLGTGYNTEDWQLGTSEPERRIDKKKALKNIADKARRNSGSLFQLSLINSVFRDSYKAGSMKRKQKLRGPFEFKCNSPVKRTPQRRRILRPIKRDYQKKKEIEIREKSKTDKRLNDSTKIEEDSRTSFSDVVREVEEKHRAREIMRRSKSEVLNITGEKSEREKSKKATNKNSENFDNLEEERNEEIEKGAEVTTLDKYGPGDLHDTPVDEVGDTQFHFDEHTTGGHDQLDEDTESDIDKEEIKKDQLEERVMENNKDDENENHRKVLKGTKPRMNVENTAKKPTRSITPGTDGARGKQKNLNEESKALGESGDERDDEPHLTKEEKQNQRNKQAKSSPAQNTRSSSVGNARPPAKKQQEPVRRPSLKVADDDVENKDDEFEENNQVRRTARLRKNQMRENFAKENKKDQAEDYASSDVSDGFRKHFERIIQDSDDCMGPSSNAKKGTASRKQSETISTNKNYSKLSRSGRSRPEEHWENERDSDDDERNKSSNKGRKRPDREDQFEDPYRFDVNTPKTNLSRATDSGFLDKTSSTASRKRTYDRRDQTPGSEKSDIRDQTPVGKVLHKSRRFGRLDVQSTGSRTHHQGYHSGDDKRTPRLQEAQPSPDENDYNFFSRPSSSNQVSRKRKGADSGFKSGSFKVEPTRQQRKEVTSKGDEYEFESNTNTDEGGIYYDDTSFVTPLDNLSISIQPRKLFQTSNPSAAKKRKTTREASGANEEDEEENGEFNDVVLISEEVQKTISNLGSEMRKTIKQKQDYVNQMATATMKLITGKSRELWSKQSSKRHALIKEFTKRVNTLIEEYRGIASRKHNAEDSMLSQMRKSLESLASYKKEQEKCLRSIMKTQKAFTETFNSLEDSAESQQVDFQNSLRKELLQYRDQAAIEVQKQEIGNIKRRIQALLTSTSL